MRTEQCAGAVQKWLTTLYFFMAVKRANPTCFQFSPNIPAVHPGRAAGIRFLVGIVTETVQGSRYYFLLF